jgi:hypothetical protein
MVAVILALMFRRSWLLFALAAGVALAGCGGDAAGNQATPSTTATPAPTVPTVDNAANGPSAAAKMICADEAQKDIAATLGAKTTRPVIGQWKRPVYSCTYTYASGVIALSVHESPGVATARDYFDQLSQKLGAKKLNAGLGQGSAQAPNDSVVVIKDDKVLDVDVSGLPAKIGTPPIARSDAALGVAATIMGCWVGA